MEVGDKVRRQKVRGGTVPSKMVYGPTLTVVGFQPSLFGDDRTVMVRDENGDDTLDYCFNLVVVGDA